MNLTLKTSCDFSDVIHANSTATASCRGYTHNRDPKHADRTQVSMVDISRAYFNAKEDPADLTYVALPNEDPHSQDI